ncbi:MAG: hypothetical protein AAGI38_24380 [Bacteroidota bacterium]
MNTIWISWLIVGITMVGPPKLKPYYYPLEKFETPVVYHLKCLGNSQEDVYLKIEAAPEQNRLLIKRYNFRKKLFNVTLETFTESGSELAYFYPIARNEGGTYRENSNKLKKEMFQWKPKIPYAYEVVYQQNGRAVTLEKTRRYDGKKKLLFMDRSERVHCLLDTYKVRVGDGMITYRQDSYFAKGMGLIGYDRHLPNGKIRRLRLARVIPISQWAN